ncbi:SCO1664 family protein [Brevibacterium samyangense]|uniref:SCO1664 family protein n=2 Tax=Brevibacterium samyangense TaxID=366888 RepID=A0ABN2TMI1_9MICO
MPAGQRHRPLTGVRFDAHPSIDGRRMTEEQVVALLRTGEVRELGRIPGASNDTRLVLVSDDGGTTDAGGGDAPRNAPLRAVLKPTAGERPLADFPFGTLAAREAAAYALSASSGADVVPPTVLRTDLPYGPASLQVYVETVDDGDSASFFLPQDLPEDWAPVFSAQTEDGTPVLVAHATDPEVRMLALFDEIANNADRKGSHIFRGHYRFDAAASPRVFGIDNGLTFHTEPKVRTVLWGFADDVFTHAESTVLESAARVVDAALTGEADGELGSLLDPAELGALADRVAHLQHAGRFPLPPDDRYPIPWPPL